MTCHHFYCIQLVSWILNAHSRWGLVWITSTSAGMGDREESVSTLQHSVPWVPHSSPPSRPGSAGYRLGRKVHTDSLPELGIKTVWVSQGFYNKLPWTWWLKTKETLPPSSRGQKFKTEVSAGSLWNLVSASGGFRQLMGSFILWMHYSNLPSSCGPLSVSPPSCDCFC